MLCRWLARGTVKLHAHCPRLGSICSSLVWVALIAGAARAQSSFNPGQEILDTEGKTVQSHQGGVLFEGHNYYWYGMSYLGPRIAPDTIPHQSYTWLLNLGVTIYSSRDLYRWNRESVQLSDVTYKAGSLLQPTNLLVRPKVIKNDRTGKFVMMAALTSPDFDTFNDVVLAQADVPQGPFRFRGKLGWCGRPNETALWTPVWKGATSDTGDRIRAFDMTLYKDDDGKAYLITAHSRMLIYELSADYSCVNHVAIMQGAEGEAPALFKDRGTYYLLASRLTGWAANENTYFTSSSVRGPWILRGPFARGPGEKTTFDGQTTFVLPVHGSPNAFIFMADRFNAVSDTNIPDWKAATHIWLPIEIDSGKHLLRVDWKDTWDLSVFQSIVPPD